MSRTVSWSNRFTSWKLRAMPTPIRSWTDWRVMSCPSNTRAPRSGREEPADQVHERGLARAVRADEGQHLALPDRQRDVVDRAGLPERLGDVADLQEAHVGESVAAGRGADRRSPRYRSAGRGRARRGSRPGPAASTRWSRPRRSRGSCRRRRRRSGPLKVRKPPSTVMNTIWPEKVQCRMSGVVRPLSGTQSAPARPGEDAGHEERDAAVPPDLDADELGPDLVVADGLERLAERRVDDHPHDRRRRRRRWRARSSSSGGEELDLVPGAPSVR